MGILDFFKKKEKKYPWPKNELIEDFEEIIPSPIIKTREIALNYVKSAENKNTNKKNKIFPSALNPKTIYIAYSYYDNGNPNIIFCARLKNGKVTRPVIQHGYCFSFYDDTQFKMASNYVNGKLDGIQVWYYPSGLIKNIFNFDNGEFHGTNYWYHENEELKMTINFNKGVRAGKISSYHDNGNLKIEGQYENDLEEGIWKFYDSEGKLIETTTYINGESDDNISDMKIDLSNVLESPIKSIDDLNLDDEKRKQLESMTIYADEDGSIYEKNEVEINWIYGIDKAFDYKEKEFEKNLVFYKYEEEDGCHVVYKGVNNFDEGKDFIDKIISQNGGQNNFKTQEDQDGYKYIHLGDLFNISYLKSYEIVEIEKVEQFKSVRNESKYGINENDVNIRSLVNGLDKILYNEGEGPANGRLCVRYNNDDSYFVYAYFNELDESLALFKKIVTNYDETHQIFNKSNKLLDELINSDGITYKSDLFELMLIGENVKYKFYITPPGGFYSNWNL